MKILFLAVQSKKSELVEEPGLASLAAYLNQYGHNVIVKRYFFENSINDLCTYINLSDIELIAITTYDRYFKYQIECAREIKKKCNVIICMGGYTASYHARKIISTYNFIDFIIRGEGEIPLLTAVTYLEEGKDISDIPGICVSNSNKNSNELKCTLIDDLDMLPYMNRDLLEEQTNNLFQLTTSRGCTSACTFCCSNSYWRDENAKRKFRCMSPERVVSEIEYVVNKYGKKRIAFTDNSYEDPGNNFERQLSIAELLIQKNLQVGYNVNYRVNFYKSVSEEFIDKMIESGLCSVFLGVESGNQFDLNLYNKRVTVKDCFESINFFKKYKGLSVMIGFISLNPYSTMDRLSKNIDFLEKTGYAADLSNITCKLIPFKGTAIFERIKEDGLLLKNEDGFTYSYKYQNADVASLDNYYSQLIREYPVLKQAKYLCGVLPTITTYLKRETKYKDNMKVYNLVLNAENELAEITAMLNQKNSQWMKELLLSKPQFYNIISENYVKKEGIAKLYQRMGIVRNKLYRDMVKEDRCFISCF